MTSQHRSGLTSTRSRTEPSCGRCGVLAWQLGGKEGYAMVRSADEKAVSPGDSLRLLFNEYSPCLILIDEWVAYARQLCNKSDLPAGDFDAQFTFAWKLSESAKL